MWGLEVVLRQLWRWRTAGRLGHSSVLFDEVHDKFMAARTLECDLEHAIMIQVHLGITFDTICMA
jgi:hypothetical protein